MADCWGAAKVEAGFFCPLSGVDLPSFRGGRGDGEMPIADIGIQTKGDRKAANADLESMWRMRPRTAMSRLPAMLN